MMTHFKHWNGQTDTQTDAHTQTDRPRCRVDLALWAGSTEKVAKNWRIG